MHRYLFPRKAGLEREPWIVLLWGRFLSSAFLVILDPDLGSFPVGFFFEHVIPVRVATSPPSPERSDQVCRAH